MLIFVTASASPSTETSLLLVSSEETATQRRENEELRKEFGRRGEKIGGQEWIRMLLDCGIDSVDDALKKTV